MVVTIVGSFLSTSETPSIYLNDKLLHFLIYFFFTILLYIARVNDVKRRASTISRLFFVITIPFVVGVSVEFTQYYFIASRQGEILDVIANTLGIILAVTLGEKLKAKVIL